MLAQATITTTSIFKRIYSALTSLQLQRFASIAVVGFFLMTTSVDNADLPGSTKAMLNDMIARGETGRPVTSAQWKAENEKLEGNPGERLERIAEESADAVGEMAEIYPGNVKTLAPGMSNDALESDD